MSSVGMRVSESQSSSVQTPSLPPSARRNQPNFCRSSVSTSNSLNNDGEFVCQFSVQLFEVQHTVAVFHLLDLGVRYLNINR